MSPNRSALVGSRSSVVLQPQVSAVEETRPAPPDGPAPDLVAVRKALLSYLAPLARRVGLHHEAEDFVQDALCRLLERRAWRLPEPLTSDSTPVARKYLRLVARSVVCDRLRSRYAAKRQLEATRRVPLDAIQDQLADWRRDPEQRVLARERAGRWVAEWRRALPRRRHRARDLRILVEAWIEGRTSRQISDELGGVPSVANVDALLHRVRRRLRRSGRAVPRRVRSAADPR